MWRSIIFFGSSIYEPPNLGVNSVTEIFISKASNTLTLYKSDILEWQNFRDLYKYFIKSSVDVKVIDLVAVDFISVLALLSSSSWISSLISQSTETHILILLFWVISINFLSKACSTYLLFISAENSSQLRCPILVFIGGVNSLLYRI